jgi:hypothetical protein
VIQRAAEGRFGACHGSLAGPLDRWAIHGRAPEPENRRHGAPSRSISAVTDPRPQPPASIRPVQYKGAPLDSERGPGLGCFRFQLVVLVILIVLTPLSVFWDWPTWLSAAMLFGVILLLFLAGQTIIFLLRLVAADRRAGRRRPLASQSRTVGQIEDDDDAPPAGPPGSGPVPQ